MLPIVFSEMTNSLHQLESMTTKYPSLNNHSGTISHACQGKMVLGRGKSCFSLHSNDHTPLSPEIIIELWLRAELLYEYFAF